MKSSTTNGMRVHGTGNLGKGAFWTLVLALIPLSATTGKSQPFDSPKVSSYASTQDVEKQIDYYVGRLTEDLADEATYADERQERVAKDADTVAVLALILGRHDQDSGRKKGATQLLELAKQISEEASDYETAKDGLEQLKQALAEPEAGEPTEWAPAADMVLLMEQVPIVNNALRRGVTSRRFQRTVDATAGHAVTLAAIAQAALVDDTYSGDEDDVREWQRLCAELRDAAADVYRAVRAEDQQTAQNGLERIVKTCDACHERFK